MRLVIDLGGRYDRTPDGAVWARSGCLYEYWTRYLPIYDEVRLVARARDVDGVGSEMRRVDGERVTFEAVPHFHGPFSYVTQVTRIRAAAEQSVRWGDAVILAGSQLAPFMVKKLWAAGYPYAMRVIGDPYNLFAPGAVTHPLRPVFRWWFTRQLRELCAGACSAIYVTERALQQRYPCPGPCAGVSDVDLPQSAFVEAPRPARSHSGQFRVIMVGSLAERYKAPHILLDAVARCIRGGSDFTLTFAGDGRWRPYLERQAIRLGIAERVTFLGQLGNHEVRGQLDQADLFVLPSFQEGLPRAVVEAMARGLPCIGSNIGGTPELLPPEDLVPPGDRAALANKMVQISRDPQRMARMSARNLERAWDFRENALQGQWMEFYADLKERTQWWLQKNDQQSYFT